MPDGRITGLGATLGFCHGLLVLVLHSHEKQPLRRSRLPGRGAVACAERPLHGGAVPLSTADLDKRPDDDTYHVTQKGRYLVRRIRVTATPVPPSTATGSRGTRLRVNSNNVRTVEWVELPVA